jgi:hypothetical protein
MRQLQLELVIRHLAHQTDCRFENMLVTSIQLGRRQRRARVFVEGQKLNNIADDLRKDKAVAARHYRHRARAQSAQLLEAAFVSQYVDRLELDPTDREVFFDPEAARSMRLPEHLDRFAHPGLAIAHAGS